jgi:hypothetical protein
VDLAGQSGGNRGVVVQEVDDDVEQPGTEGPPLHGRVSERFDWCGSWGGHGVWCDHQVKAVRGQVQRGHDLKLAAKALKGHSDYERATVAVAPDACLARARRRQAPVVVADEAHKALKTLTAHIDDHGLERGDGAVPSTAGRRPRASVLVDRFVRRRVSEQLH